MFACLLGVQQFQHYRVHGLQQRHLQERGGVRDLRAELFSLHKPNHLRVVHSGLQDKYSRQVHNEMLAALFVVPVKPPNSVHQLPERFRPRHHHQSLRNRFDLQPIQELHQLRAGPQLLPCPVSIRRTVRAVSQHHQLPAVRPRQHLFLSDVREGLFQQQQRVVPAVRV